jgi:hypothetical protein
MSKPKKRTFSGTSLSREKRTSRALIAVAKIQTELSGKQWVARFLGSNSTGDLAPPFQSNVDAFLAALKKANAAVTVSATLRPKERAYLMHWSWKIARGEAEAKRVPPMDGVLIQWDHGNADASKRAAADMVAGYGISAAPSLTSIHIQGRAIDMTISWMRRLSIVNKAGLIAHIDSEPRTGMNKELIAIGASYGVVKASFSGDEPHWSDNGT